MRYEKEQKDLARPLYAQPTKCMKRDLTTMAINTPDRAVQTAAYTEGEEILRLR